MPTPRTVTSDQWSAASSQPEPVPALRLLPAPTGQPPFDDEVASAPVLRLVTSPAGGPPRVLPAVPGPADAPHPPRALRRRLQDPDGKGESCGWAQRRDGTAAAPVLDLPPARPFAHALVQRLLEVSAGVRPLAQLRPDTTPELFAQLEQALTARPRAAGLRPSRRDVRSVHVQERPDGIAEVCATVVRGRRPGALALRIEGARGRWLCTQLVGV